MKIDPREIPTLRSLPLGSPDDAEFDSPLPDEDLISESWGNPDLASVVDNEAIGKKLVKATARANKWVLGIEGVTRGIPSEALKGFGLAVGDSGASKWVDFAAGTAVSTMDIGLDSMGAVPIIGWAAKLSIVVVEMLLSLSKRKRARPELLRYNKKADELKATRILEAKYGGDLTPVFLPPRRQADWRVAPRDGGFAVVWSGGDDPRDGSPGGAEGMGVIPGGYAVSGQLSSYEHWSFDTNQNAPGWAEARNGNITKRGRKWVRNNPSIFEGTIEPPANQWPCMRRAALAAWSSLTSTKTAGAFDIETKPIIGAWTNWARRADEQARAAMNGGESRMTVDRYVGYRALQDSARIGFYGVDIRGNPTLGEVAKDNITELRLLQLSLLDTLVCAYASEKQVAFRDDPALSDKLRARRLQLLSHSARWRVSLSDIVDPDYRAAMRDATRDRPLVARVPDDFNAEPKRVSPLPDLQSEEAGGALAAAAAAGLAFAFL